MPEYDALFAAVEGFDWDAGNTTKNVVGHGVSQSEAEAIFFHAPLLLLEDAKHSREEQRYLILGTTGAGRLLTAAFTIRGPRIRIISVRDMSRKERQVYEEAAR